MAPGSGVNGPERKAIEALSDLVLHRELRLLRPVASCLSEYRWRDDFHKAAKRGRWHLHTLPEDVAPEAVDEAIRLLEIIYRRRQPGAGVIDARGIAWERLVHDAVRHCSSQGMIVHYDCYVFVNGTKISSENEWDRADERNSVGSLDVAEWWAQECQDGQCKLCSCKLTASGFWPVEARYLHDVWDATGSHALACVALASEFPSPQRAIQKSMDISGWPQRLKDTKYRLITPTFLYGILSRTQPKMLVAGEQQPASGVDET
jgi:hypothetical protein